MFKQFRKLTLFPDLTASIQDVELGNRVWTLEIYYRPRLRSWYVDITDEDGVPLVLNRRLSGETLPTNGRLDFDGELYLYNMEDEADLEKSRLFYFQLRED